MAKPYMCGDKLPVYVPDGGCNCSYTIEKDTSGENTVYKLVTNGEQVGVNIEVPETSEYTIESTASSSNKTFYNLTKDGEQEGETIVVSNTPDFIIDQGIDGDWVYRKWDSGIAEGGGVFDGTVNITTQWGGCYYAPAVIFDFPTDFFSDTPVVQAFNSSGGSSMVMGNGAIDETHFGIHFVRGNSASGTAYHVGIYAIGKWN